MEKEEEIVWEWEFPEPSHEVDLERICREVSDIPVVVALAYMENLKIRAPVVYGRLKLWAKEKDLMTWYNWKSEGGGDGH